MKKDSGKGVLREGVDQLGQSQGLAQDRAGGTETVSEIAN